MTIEEQCTRHARMRELLADIRVMAAGFVDYINHGINHVALVNQNYCGHIKFVSGLSLPHAQSILEEITYE